MFKVSVIVECQHFIKSYWQFNHLIQQEKRSKIPPTKGDGKNGE
jgi:hypothetical protein